MNFMKLNFSAIIKQRYGKRKLEENLIIAVKKKTAIIRKDNLYVLFFGIKTEIHKAKFKKNNKNKKNGGKSK